MAGIAETSGNIQCVARWPCVTAASAALHSDTLPLSRLTRSLNEFGLQANFVGVHNRPALEIDTSPARWTLVETGLRESDGLVWAPAEIGALPATWPDKRSSLGPC